MSNSTDLGYLKTEAEFKPLDACPWCEGNDLAPLATRGDGLPVLRCNTCHLGFLGELPEDVSVFYDDEYYVRSPIPGTAPAVSGYEDYERSYSPSSFRWLTSLITAAGFDGGRLFDLGTATGTFLEMARLEGFEPHGAELTEEGAAAARDKGLDVRTGFFDPQDWEPKSFNIVTALEVFEHTTDLRTLVRGLKQLLANDGILVFFVPNVTDKIIDEYGDAALDFNKSFDHTLYFNPASLTRIIEDTFGPGSLTLFAQDVEQWGQHVSSALGVVRVSLLDDPPEKRVFDIVQGRRPVDDIDTITDATVVALSAEKFFQHDLADAALVIAEDLGATDQHLVPIRAQVLRNRGEILNAIQLLEGAVLADPNTGGSVAGPLLVETLGDFAEHIGIEEPGLAVAMRGILERLDATKLLQQAIDQVEERERDFLARSQKAEESAAGARERAVDAEARMHAAERNRERSAGIVHQARANLRDAQDRLEVAEVEKEAASETAEDLRTTLNEIYGSRTWKLASLPWRLKDRLTRRGPAPVAIAEDDSQTIAPETAPQEHASFPVTVSVIMPVYNKGKTIRESIESVLTQTLQDLEVIVWDDGSTDDRTREALADLESLPQVQVVHAANQGVVGARNSAMRLARGEFYICLDPDDRITPTYLEKAVLYLKSHPEISIVYPWQRSVGDVEEIWQTANLDPSQISATNHVPVCAVFREGVFTATGGFSPEMSDGAEDWEFWTHASELGYRGRVIPECLFEYSYSHDASESRDAQAREQAHEIAARIESLHPALDMMRERPLVGTPAPARLDVGPSALPSGKGRPVIMMLPWMTVGGADRVVKALANHWTDQGRTVVGVTTLGVSPGMVDRIEDLLEITPYTYQLPSILPVSLWYEFVDNMLEGLPDATILNIGSSWFYDYARRLQERHPGLRIIDQQFNDSGHIEGNHAARESIDLTVTAYKALRDRFLDDGRSASEVTEIYVGVEPTDVGAEAIAAARKDLGLSSGDRYAVFVGRLSEEKRPEWLLPLADKAGPSGVKLVVVGTGPLADSVGPELDRRDSIIWVKHIEDVAAVFAGADLTVMPSSIEGIPLTAMESLAVGTPVVATAVGGLPELSHVRGVYLTDPKVESAFVDEAMRVLTSPPTDPIALPDGLTVQGMVEMYDRIIDHPVEPLD